MDTAIVPFRSMDALREGWTKTKANLTPLLLLGAVGGFLGILQQTLRAPSSNDAGPLLALVVQVLQALLMMVYMRAAIALERGRPLELTPRAELFEGFFDYLLTSLLYGLIVAAGFVLLIMPGVIWGLKFAFATLLTVDASLDPIAALRESARLTHGVKGSVLKFALLMVVVNAVGAMALGIGLLVTIPTTMIATVHVLRRLQARAQLPAHQVPRAEVPASAGPPPETSAV